MPIQIGFLVAFAQLIPAHTVTLFRGIISLRVVRFPLAYVGVVTLLSLTPLLSGASFLLALSGFLTSWTYLRFYKTVFPDLDSSSQSPSLRGDASETFAFAEFFPAPVRPAVATAADSVFDLLVQARLCTPFSPADVSAARGDSANSYLQRGTPGTARAEAERRRAIALRALDQRLNAASASGPGPSSASAGNPSASNQSPAATAGPSADTKTQTATTSKPGEMLGETKFEPDDHEDHGATKS